MPRIVLPVLLASAVCVADSALRLEVSNETAPPGGWVQIKLWLSAPRPEISNLVMDLDPSVLGDIADVAIFSSNGDAYGYAHVDGRHLDTQFSSGPGLVNDYGRSYRRDAKGFGQVRNLPVLVVTAPVLVNAALGKTTLVTARLSGGISVTPGSVTVGGSLSIQNVTPGGGIVPADTVVHISGAGFTPTTTVQTDEVSISAVQFAGPEQIDVILGAPTELTGKRFVLQNRDGSRVEWFSFLPDRPEKDPGRLRLMFPAQAWSATRLASLDNTIIPRSGFNAIQNPNLVPVEVTVQIFCLGGLCGTPRKTQLFSRTVPAGGSWTFGFSYSPSTVAEINSTGPIRALHLVFQPNSFSYWIEPLYPSRPISIDSVKLTADPAFLSWQWQIGSPAPRSRTITVAANSRGVTLQPATVSGGSWLSVEQSRGSSECPCSLVATVNPSGLESGDYEATIAVTPTSDTGPSLQIPVSLTVTSGQTLIIAALPGSLTFNVVYPEPAPPPQTVAVLGSGGQGRFSIAADTGLSVSPSSGTLPAVLTVSVDLALIRLYNPKKIVINGPQNDITIPVNLKVSGLQANPASFAFSAKEGSAAQTQTLRVDLASNVVSPLTVSVSMDSGSAWLSATVINASLFIRVNIDPGRLPAGQYTGRIIVSAAGAGSVQIPVALTIWGTPPPLTVRPSTLTLKYPGSVSPQTLTVESAGVPLPLNILESQLLWVTRTSDVTPASISVSIRDIRFVAGAYEGVTEEPGEFHSSIQIATTGTTITVPVTILIEPRAPPVIGSVVNTASRIQRAIAPGEILTIHGYAAGPPNTLGFTLDPSGTVTTSYNGTQVLFDGKPAPLLYASPYQTNLVVPFEVADRKSTNIEVVYNGAKSAAWGPRSSPATKLAWARLPLSTRTIQQTPRRIRPRVGP